MRTLALSLALAVSAVPARGEGGAHPFEFLSLDADARAVAMGGAYTALAADANALLYNPAGLGFVDRNEAVFMHNQYFQGVSQEYAAFASRRGWGAQVNYLDFGAVPQTSIANKAGTGLGTYRISDLALTGGYSRRVADGFAVGGGLKYIREQIHTVSAGGMAFDGGALWRPDPGGGLRVGAALRNMGPDVKFQRSPEKLPLQLRMGAAYEFPLRGLPSVLAVDVIKKRLERPTAAIGLETVLAGRLPLRLGYDMRNDAGLGLTAGFGWVTRDVRLDYAFVSFGVLGSAHRVSAAVRWGAGRTEPAPRAADSRGRPKSIDEARVALASESPAPAAGAPARAAPGPAPAGVPRHLWPDYHLARARESLDANEPVRAERHLGEAEPLLGEHPNLRLPFLVMRGRAAYLGGSRARALADWLSAVRLAEETGSSRSEVAEAHAGIAQILLAERRDAEAAAHLRLALRAHPSEELRGRIERTLRVLESGR